VLFGFQRTKFIHVILYRAGGFLFNLVLGSTQPRGASKMLQGKWKSALGGSAVAKLPRTHARPAPFHSRSQAAFSGAIVGRREIKNIPCGKRPLYFQRAPVLGNSKYKGFPQASFYQVAPGDPQQRALIQNGIFWWEEPTPCFPPGKPLFFLEKRIKSRLF
jgi:hypothetical protein